MAKVKARRYLIDGLDKGFVWDVLRTLPYASFELAREFYDHYDRYGLTLEEERFLAANDRFYLLVAIFRRKDAFNEYVYDRCREVEEEPDNRLDLWARYHYKSSIITFAGSIQEIINNPEITIGIFSNTIGIAQAFLDQIKRELEENDKLKALFPDVFWQDPRQESPAWSQSGIVVKRKGNPKEATVEAHGVVNAMPTGKHFDILLFDDLVSEKSVTTTDTNQATKTTTRFELAQNLGHAHSRRQMAGTRYSYADTYGVLIDRGTVIVRKHAATHDGTMNGVPVFLSPERWEEVKRDQRSTVAAQMLLNPLAGQANTFSVDHLRPYELRPRELNVYIMVDPAGGRAGRKSDRTAMAVVGVDPADNRFFLDGYCHRMRSSERMDNLVNLWKKWKRAPYVQAVRVGYERYGLQADTEILEERILREKLDMQWEELAWPREGPPSKIARIGRLEPYFRMSQFWMPPKVWHPDLGVCTWRVTTQQEPLMLEGQPVRDKKSGAIVMVDVEGSAEIIYTPYKGPSKAEVKAKANGEGFRVMEPVKRVDEDGNVYDLTRMFFEEFRLHPFAPHDDLTDATSRIQDMQPGPPMVIGKIDGGRGKVFADT